MNISLVDAKQIVEAAVKRAIALNKPITIAIVDAAGYLVALERMDGARPIQPAIANAKAYTGAIMQRPGLMLKGWQDSQPQFFSQLSTMGLHPILATEGALPIRRQGELVGGLGVAGGTGPEDQQLCEAVLGELGYDLNFEQFNSIRKKGD